MGKNWVRDFLEKSPDVSRLPIYKTAEHSIHFKKSGGEVEAYFTCAPMYVRVNGVLQPADTRLCIQPDGTYAAPGLAPRIEKNRVVQAGSYVGQTSRIGVYDPKKDVFKEIVILPEGKVFDDQVISEQGIYRHELTLTESGVRDELILSANPGLQPGEWFAIETLINGKVLATGEQQDFSIGDYRFPSPRAWDAGGKEAPTKRFAGKTKTGQQVLYTCIPAEWLETAKYEVRVDPDFASGMSYGYTYGASATYATARSTSAGSATTSLMAGQDYNTGSYVVYRSGLNFATDSISPNTVLTANIRMVCIQDLTTTNTTILFKKYSWSAISPISAATRETFHDNSITATADGNWKNTADVDWAINVQFTSAALATDWVVTNSTTWYAIVSSRDVAATQPSNSEAAQIAKPDHVTESYRPVEIITYNVARRKSLALLGVG